MINIEDIVVFDVIVPDYEKAYELKFVNHKTNTSIWAHMDFDAYQGLKVTGILLAYDKDLFLDMGLRGDVEI